ncbi:MAG: 50S ribosomal protein L3 [Candidatus Daviesbacteria bacterium GW2011_GWA1_41_61]|uniref:Large ribosomal subunit protein uL3 n=1 Tax=Candidatus Daviesbacteria bacterium GW2011_GWA2_40_9 TaxID=1618424 RepID=A0A0G0U2J3_9BACT|nr:MAG: ribosomal protein L3, large subunit ribosomal protein L3 [Candidatus Daviesbacteria bacterium GW2011_GWC1_40_9]KKR83319.1 MAG: 50S ribosomal protein L3 [Candidatus Daviesbacteria bacterium GW2011_GWA2_40_9]KKR93250.1 MAG: 50S ribosomal protein L3 [Candidatus Daviesbacteria bacterium GW2011_GWB1_41_15]KKS14738.1 MAG: 50S ribosomal protein L3 [Candidatus Daviesbacteria bacterium GW2011_GWA1_41_61]
MIDTLLGVKKYMTSTYDARGRRVGVTVIEVQPNMITQIKSDDSKDGYQAVQLGYGAKKSVKKPQLGHLKKAKVAGRLRWLKEIRGEEKGASLGEQIEVSKIFKKGDAVKVSGLSKGRGFQGGVKRYGFAGGPKTHGQSDRHRAPGSIGSGTTPGRVLKGKRMAGHMGASQVSVRGLEVISVDKLNNFLVVKGGVPGHPGALLRIQNIGKIKGYTPPPEEKEDEEESDAKALADKGDEVAETREPVEVIKEEGSEEGTENA